MYKQLSCFIISIALLCSCTKTTKIEQEIEAIPIDLTIERFDQDFANATLETLPKLKKQYEFMFSKKDNDSVLLKKINDSYTQQLSAEVKKKFSNIQEVKQDIELVFKHLKYYDNSFNTPRVVSLTDYVDYRNKVFVTDSVVLIALDNYLGQDHKFYSGIYKYIAQNLRASQIAPDLAFAFAEQKLQQHVRKTFLEEIIYYGKIYYFMDIIIPFKTDEEKIGYTPKQLTWAKTNETNIWTYFVENELFYKRDAKLISRFINPAPFSRFNLELDKESPGRIGRYIGWQIVRSYMKHNTISLDKLLSTDTEQLFNNAKYKPRR